MSEVVDNNGDVNAPSENTHITAHIPKEGLRSLFHLMVGHPDSIQQVYYRQILVDPNALQDLHDRINEKLKNHEVEAMVVTVDVTFDNNKTIQFGTWPEFKAHRWTEADRTRDIVLKWDFVVKIPEYEFPQRHAVLIRLTGEIKPLHLMQTIFSRDLSEIDNLEFEYVPVFCRIDFINNVLSKELLSIVEKWNKSLPQPESKLSIFNKVKKHSLIIGRMIEYSIPCFVMLVVFSSLFSITNELDPNSNITVGIMAKLMYWLMGSFSVMFITIHSANWIAKKSFSYLESYGRYNLFIMTNGDKERQTELKHNNKQYINKFIFSALVSLLLNIVAGIIVARLIQ